MDTAKKTGVLLLNLGGPEQTEDVEAFLYNLFSDRQIIRLGPFFLQKFIARRIAKKRAPKSIVNYNKIGGGSPIRQLSEEQASQLEKQLAPYGEFLVRVCMRYWHPFASETIDELIRAGVDELIALPLYPHYSVATTGSSLSDLRRTLKNKDIKLPLKTIKSWPTEAGYITALADSIQEELSRFGNEEVALVYSAHSLPVKFIEDGDPYVDELQQTIKALEKKIGQKGTLCYQSRSGPVEWLGPSTPETITSLADSSCKNMLVVPLSFVSDHVETLYEIDMEYRTMAESLGMRFAITPGLNSAPHFIDALRNLVLRCLQREGPGD